MLEVVCQTNRREKSLNVAIMTRVALIAAVTVVAAQIAIPLASTPVPFTLQVLAILSGLLLGARYREIAQVIYVLLGVVARWSSPSFTAASVSFWSQERLLVLLPFRRHRCRLSSQRRSQRYSPPSVVDRRLGCWLLFVLELRGSLWVLIYPSRCP